MWRESGNASSARPKANRVRRVRRGRRASGAGIFGDIGNVVDGVGHMFGLGLPKEKVESSDSDCESESGAGIFGDIGNVVDGVGHMFGLGLSKNKKLSKRQIEKIKLIHHMEGKGIFDDILDGVSKGVKTAADVVPAGLSLYKTFKGGDARRRHRRARGGDIGDILKTALPLALTFL